MPKNDWTTAVGEVGPGIINVRGYPISELIGNVSFAEAVFLTIRGELPTPAQERLMNAALTSLLDHGLYSPSALAARVVTSTAPHGVVHGLATGILTIGSVTVSPQHAAEVIERVQVAIAEGRSLPDAAGGIAQELVDQDERMPGYGHPLHSDADPRAQILESIARETGLWTERSEGYLATGRAYLELVDRDLPVNVDGMLGCVLSELGFRAIEMPGVAAISYLPGIVAHCAEEVAEAPTLRIAEARYVGAATRHLDGATARGDAPQPV